MSGMEAPAPQGHIEVNNFALSYETIDGSVEAVQLIWMVLPAGLVPLGVPGTVGAVVSAGVPPALKTSLNVGARNPGILE